MEFGHFDKYFIKNTQKRPRRKKLCGVFSPVLNGKFNKKIDKTRAFFLKSGHFFRFLKKGRGGLHFLICTFFTVVYLFCNVARGSLIDCYSQNICFL